MEVKIKLNKTNKKDILILTNGIVIDKKKYVKCNLDENTLERLTMFDDVLIKSLKKEIIVDNIDDNNFIEIIENEDNKNMVENNIIETNNSTLSGF